MNSMEQVLEELIRHKPGITSAQLFEGAREFHGKLWHERLTPVFEKALWAVRDKGYRVTNKQWYPAGHTAAPKLHNGTKPHPKQTRMDW